MDLRLKEKTKEWREDSRMEKRHKDGEKAQGWREDSRIEGKHRDGEKVEG